VVIAVGKPAKRWLFSESIRNILLMKKILFYFVCHPHYVYTARGFNAVPGSATWFFRDCIVKSVERCGGFARFIQDYFTEETDGGRNGLRTFGMLMPNHSNLIVQMQQRYLVFLKTFHTNNGHMRIPTNFHKDFRKDKQKQKEMQRLYSFFAEMRHRIVINRFPPTEMGKELKAIGFELHSKPLEGSPNAPTHKWTGKEDRLLLNAQLAIGNEWNQIVLHLPGRTPFDVSNHWRELIGLPKFLSNSQRQQSGLTTLSKWTEDEDRILLERSISSGNQWKQIIRENFSHWTLCTSMGKTLMAVIKSSTSIPRGSSWSEMISNNV
jgi:hypothetical protein